MLFNSAVFLFAFLPATLLLYFMLGRREDPRLALSFLVVASLFFYSWWSLQFLPVLLGSILANSVLGYLLIERSYSPTTRRSILIGGLVLNLALLGYFKYAHFIASNLNQLLGIHLPLASVALPLGISFFTFQKIAFLVDAHRGLVRRFKAMDYSLFVTFFPQLIAGPIVHHAEIIPQFNKPAIAKPNAFNLAMGLSIFCIGLFMKNILADGSAFIADPIFKGVEAGQAPGPALAWVGAFAYSFQLYFDFAGYSAMALGLGRMFNIVLPLNFYSPYKAVNIIDFWRRWHITLSRFLRDYLYFPLGGNRRGQSRRYMNLFITMVLGGLWHGAAWTFVLWGGLHAVFLILNHAWQTMLEKAGLRRERGSRVGRAAARTLTFLVVVTAWVPFRSTSFDTMSRMLQAMYGVSGDALLPSFKEYLAGQFQLIGSGDLSASIVWLLLVGLIALGAPNIYDLFRPYHPGLLEPRTEESFPPARPWLEWTLSRSWALLCALLLVISLTQVGRLSPFLYFQF